MVKMNEYKQPEIVIIDLGLVHTAAFHNGFVSGTPGYIAPETWTTANMYPGSDLFAMGTVMMQLLLDMVPPHHNPPKGCKVLPGGIFTQGAQTLEDVSYLTCSRTPQFGQISGKHPLLTSLLRSLLNKDVAMRPCAQEVAGGIWFLPEDREPVQEVATEDVFGFQSWSSVLDAMFG